MKKSLLTLIALLSSAHIFTSSIVTVGTGAASAASGIPTGSAFSGTGHVTGSNGSTSTQAISPSKFNLMLEKAVRTVVPTATIDAITESKATQAGLHAYNATKVDSWNTLTMAQLNAIGEAILREATDTYKVKTGPNASQQDTIIANAKKTNILAELAQEIKPSWVEENPGTTCALVGLAGTLGYLRACHNDTVDMGKVATKLGYAGLALAALRYRNSINNSFKNLWKKVTGFKPKEIVSYLPTIATMSAIIFGARYIAKHNYDINKVVANAAETAGIAKTAKPWYQRWLENTTTNQTHDL